MSRLAKSKTLRHGALNYAQKEVIKMMEDNRKKYDLDDPYRTPAQEKDNRTIERKRGRTLKESPSFSLKQTSIKRRKIGDDLTHENDDDDEDEVYPETIMNAKHVKSSEDDDDNDVAVEIQDKNIFFEWLNNKDIAKPLSAKSLKEILDTDMDLSDEVIHKSLNLLEYQFPIYSGFIPPKIIVSVNNYDWGMLYSNDPFIQIVNLDLDDQNHWITITNLGVNSQNKIRIFDSNFKIENCENEIFLAQLKKLLSLGNSEQLKIVFESVQQQEQDYEDPMSGLFAVAFAYDLCIGKNPSKQHYNESKMRDHLYKCIQKYHFDEFPKYKRAKIFKSNSLYEINKYI